MSKIQIKNYNTVVTVILDRYQENEIEAIKKVIQILNREVVKYEYGISPNIDRHFPSDLI